MKTAVFYNGFEAKKIEIKEMGWESARDKFNLEYPSGRKWEGTIHGLEYAQGEFEAICKHANKAL